MLKKIFLRYKIMRLSEKFKNHYNTLCYYLNKNKSSLF